MQTTEEPQVAAPIDPRIHERRVAVRRDEGRRRLRLVIVGATLLALLVVGWGATRSPFLDVDRIRVEGATATPARTVVGATGIDKGRPMTGIDEATVARRVRALPWVDRATVRRDWPGTLIVRVTERSPVAVARARSGGWMLVDRTGRLLGTVAEPPEELVALEVPGTAPAGKPGEVLDDRARGALRVGAALPRDRVRQLRVVALRPDGLLELRMVPAGVVLFGPPSDVGAKLLAALTVLDRVDLRNVRGIDVRVPAAPVLTRTAS